MEEDKLTPTCVSCLTSDHDIATASTCNYANVCLIVGAIFHTEHAIRMSDMEVCPTEGQSKEDKLFTVKKWNGVASWNWDVECDTCAICRIQLMETCLRCQSETKQNECVVAWGECNHCFHNCCMSLWVKQNNRCPLCQQDWQVQRIGK